MDRMEFGSDSSCLDFVVLDSHNDTINNIINCSVVCALWLLRCGRQTVPTVFMVLLFPGASQPLAKWWTFFFDRVLCVCVRVVLFCFNIVCKCSCLIFCKISCSFFCIIFDFWEEILSWRSCYHKENRRGTTNCTSLLYLFGTRSCVAPNRGSCTAVTSSFAASAFALCWSDVFSSLVQGSCEQC